VRREIAKGAPPAAGRGLARLPNARVKPLEAILEGARRNSLHRSLGVFQLTMLGVGGIIGSGIFVLIAEAAQKAGPGMILSFIVAGVVCAVAALCYSELAAMVPVAGSAYTYTYAVMGELLAWLVGWCRSVDLFRLRGFRCGFDRCRGDPRSEARLTALLKSILTASHEVLMMQKCVPP